MEEMDIKQQFHLLQKEVEAAVALSEDTKLNLLSAIDSLQIQVEVLRRFIERCHMGFACRYPELREEVLREVDPEWLEGGGTRKRGDRAKGLRACRHCQTPGKRRVPDLRMGS